MTRIPSNLSKKKCLKNDLVFLHPEKCVVFEQRKWSIFSFQSPTINWPPDNNNILLCRHNLHIFQSLVLHPPRQRVSDHAQRVHLRKGTNNNENSTMTAHRGRRWAQNLGGIFGFIFIFGGFTMETFHMYARYLSYMSAGFRLLLRKNESVFNRHHDWVFDFDISFGLQKSTSEIQRMSEKDCMKHEWSTTSDIFLSYKIVSNTCVHMYKHT